MMIRLCRFGTRNPYEKDRHCVIHTFRKAFAKDLKTIYNAPTEKEGREALDTVTAAWEEKYPRAMKRW